MSASDLPTGTVTFLFTDIEGSTRLLQELGRDRYRLLQNEHAGIMRRAIGAEDGAEIRTEGDSFFVVFPTPSGALRAAVGAQRGLATTDVRVRMGLHTGEGWLGGDDYVGIDVNRAARIAAAGHGRQVLVSSATAALVEADLPDGVKLLDLGRHRLKDLARPERILQLIIDGLPTDFPPITSLETPTNLPVTRTSFIGREDEVIKVRELLQGPGLFTLTGPGGSGKTRLALEAARTLLDDYPDGVFLVELAPLTDHRLIPSSIAESIGVKAEGRRPVLETLREQVRDREMLLILDNFEHLVGGAPAVADLLDAAPRTRIMVTSREPLHVSGEQELPVPPLGLPGPDAAGVDALRGAEAVALFVHRASAVDPQFRLTETNAATVAELCRRLDGLPLAIELAASRAKVLVPEAILDRLEHRLELLTGGPVDLPSRQRTLRGAIAWSHDLLSEDERVVFRRLSVFAGGWTMEAAEAVGGNGGDVLEPLASLVDKSLVQRRTAGGEARYAMLETIREFAGEQLDAAEETEAIRDRHASFFLKTAERAEPHLRAVGRKRWLDDLELEHDNLRAALRWTIDGGRSTTGLRLVGALWRFWHVHGHLAEGRRWAEEVLALPASTDRTAERGAALTSLGGVAYWQEDIPATRRAYEEALDLARELGDRPAEAEGLYNLSYPPAYEGDIPTAVATGEEALSLYRELGIHRGVADCLWLMAIVARLEGDVAEARARVEESLRIHRDVGDEFGITDALHVLGRIALDQRDLETAKASFLEALENDEHVGNRTGMGIVLDNLAAAASMEGRHLAAVRLAGASESIKEAAGGHAPPPFIDLPDPRTVARDALSDEAIDAAWQEGQAMTLDQALAYARRET
jgi:predicted ATPase/class 3 adenylate cyclase